MDFAQPPMAFAAGGGFTGSGRISLHQSVFRGTVVSLPVRLLRIGLALGTNFVDTHCGILALALVVRTVLEGQIGWMRAMGWIGLVVVTFAAGGGLAFLGDLSRRYVAENEFLSRITGTMQVDQGLAESLRLLLDELANAFHTEEAMLAFRDVDLERIFLWRLKAGKVSG